MARSQTCLKVWGRTSDGADQPFCGRPRAMVRRGTIFLAPMTGDSFDFPSPKDSPLDKKDKEISHSLFFEFERLGGDLLGAW